MTRLIGSIAVVLAGLVLMSGGDGGKAPGSLARLGRLGFTGPAAAGESVADSTLSDRLFASAGLRHALAAVVALCLLLTVGGVTGVLVASVAGPAVDRLLARVPDPAAARAAGAAERDLPFALDLLCCALRAGQPPSSAAAAVARAIDGPVGSALSAVSRGIDLGSPPELAWEPLGRLPGAAVAARTLARAAGSGTRLAGELSGTAADLRLRRAAASEARVRRAGVLVVLPLGMCFLPAFVCVGVVPIVVGIAGTVLR